MCTLNNSTYLFIYFCKEIAVLVTTFWFDSNMPEYHGSVEWVGVGEEMNLKYIKELIFLNNAIHFNLSEMCFSVYALLWTFNSQKPYILLVHQFTLVFQGALSRREHKYDGRWSYSLTDDVFTEETAPTTRSTAKDYLFEEETSYSTKDGKSQYATQRSKENLLKLESSATHEAPAVSKSLAEEQSSALLSTRYSVNAQTGSAQVSASLPRSYQKTDTSRLTSVVTPRPFGVHSRGISSLPRSLTVKFSLVPEICKCWLSWIADWTVCNDLL